MLEARCSPSEWNASGFVVSSLLDVGAAGPTFNAEAQKHERNFDSVAQVRTSLEAMVQLACRTA